MVFKPDEISGSDKIFNTKKFMQDLFVGKGLLINLNKVNLSSIFKG